MENLRDLFQVMTRRFGLLDKSCASVGGVDLSITHSHILYEIDRQDNPSMQQIADRLGIDITTFSRQIQNLVQLNLVRKAPSPVDRRVSILSLTTEGKFIAATIDSQMNEYLNEIFSYMSEFERNTVMRSVELLNECMAKSPRCCNPMGVS
ncbi:MarR family winged helix-turn-helix transcriptional regulator [Paenibacillus tarimensis]|uniref:MarR family winged helix-turn-helix transcriptional regulator n=1 Tax=Paenibacillus tarimensis TaxID=416012 RepID=UPI001F2592EF|nr:MarR family winged helix-turn-helix transcriptional regulator [Paenibacillus tarimensis]MCF2945282.1 MarR family winged helix-turn-helix transcriptional regulator [Paenibacillus tarimensis]